jgi:hypothetical protein
MHGGGMIRISSYIKSVIAPQGFLEGSFLDFEVSILLIC